MRARAGSRLPWVRWWRQWIFYYGPSLVGNEDLTEDRFNDRGVTEADWNVPLPRRGWHDPTHGQIDRDIQERVAALHPTSLGQRTAMENTLQARRNRSDHA